MRNIMKQINTLASRCVSVLVITLFLSVAAMHAQTSTFTYQVA